MKCNRCGIEKLINDFYGYSNNTFKSICKYCENTNPSKNKLWYCEFCGITIRQYSKMKHLNSRRHFDCYFSGEKYNSERLQRQNKRSL